MNKKGFTLVEIIVSVALLALIGVIVGISLNSIIKRQQVSSYEEYVEKVKSSTLLYVNNTPSIINELNDNYSYKILEARDVISNGYLNENLIDPSTKEKINQNDKIKAYYDENYELMIDYPYENNNGENYLYTRNYNAIYNSDEINLCYIGINTNELQIINSLTGLKVGVNLISYNENNTNANIIAYMEDGRLCTDEIINTSKIGSYKIRYTYTIDGTPVSSSNNKKTAERTITIKPSKPKINSFDIKPQSDNSVYDASLNLSVTDVKDVALKYCIVGVKSDDKIEINSLFSKCQNTPKIINNITQLNNYWIDLDNGAYDSISKKEKYVVNNKTFNIQSEMNELSDYDEVKFYIFVKNNYEEYSNKLNEYNNGIYYLTSTVEFNLLSSDVYFDNIKKTSDNIYSIKKIKNNTAFNEVITANPNYAKAYRAGYVFLGWTTVKESNIVEYNSSSTTKLNGILKLYPVWKTDNNKPTCTLKLNNNKIEASYSDDNELIYYGWDSSYKEISSTSKNIAKGTYTFYVKDSALNVNSCKIDIQNTVKSTTEVSVPYEDEETREGCYGYAMSCDCQDGNGLYVVWWYNYNLKQKVCQCCWKYTEKVTKYRTETKTVINCSDNTYTRYNDDYCYKY